MVNISAIVLEIGVPVANTTPRPLLAFMRYCVFINISIERWLLACDIPAILRIFVAKYKFLNWSASSTKIWSTPNCSNGITTSFASSLTFFLSLASRFFFVASSVLTIALPLLPSVALISKIACSTSAICCS